jgi:DNA-binding beta-propeller fold protein YncE
VVTGFLTAAGLNPAAPVVPTTPVTPNSLAEVLWAAYRDAQSSGSASSATAAGTSQTTPATNTALTVVDTIPVDPYQIALSPDGTRLYGTSSPITASSQSAGTVQVVDTAINTQIGNPIPVGIYAENVAVSPTTNRAYVTALQPATFTINGQQIPGGSDGLVVIDTTTNKVVGSPILIGASQNGSHITETSVAGPTGSNVAVSPDGSRVYVSETTYSVDTSNPSSATFQPNIYVIDTKTNTQVGNPIPIGPPTNFTPNSTVVAGPILVSPSGDRLYATTINISHSGGGSPSYTYTIHPINPSTGTPVGTPIVVDTTSTLVAGPGQVLSPDGKKLYVETVQIPTTTAGQTSNNQQVPNGTVLTYDTTTGQQIGTPINLTGFGPIAVSPDGKTLYVADVADSRTGKTGTFPGTNQATPLGSVTAYDASTGAQTANPVTVGLYPTSLAINSTGTKLYVANAADNTISVIDIGGNSGGSNTGNPFAFVEATIGFVSAELFSAVFGVTQFIGAEAASVASVVAQGAVGVGEFIGGAESFINTAADFFLNPTYGVLPHVATFASGLIDTFGPVLAADTTTFISRLSPVASLALSGLETASGLQEIQTGHPASGALDLIGAGASAVTVGLEVTPGLEEFAPVAAAVGTVVEGVNDVAKALFSWW